MRVAFLTLALLTFDPAAAFAQSLCEGNDYQRGLCAYRAGDFSLAEKLFTTAAGVEERSPEAIKARYFLARSLMKRRQWQRAADEFVRIYGLAPLFYDEWNCDFLLGECRKAQGKD